MTERNDCIGFTGIDPGVRGALVTLEMEHGWGRPRLMECLDLDGSDASFGRARRMLERSCVIVVERQQASPQMGRGSAFELGRQVGLVRGMLGTLGLTPVMVSPTVWRGSFGLGGGADGKAAGMALAAELLGADADWALYRHDIADAVLLAWWGWRHAVAEVEDAAW
jgi:hypothetical protein